ncbi:exo-alpha-sialidase [Stieleria sp. ICT_E10.1]|uniref:exo-alpha-sialidase n=1 Tax=Stieleria sedimenti TaxID=2976331 RepID=UPI0021803FF2|nr:exo-alpha-sialidase [Stieleria sedimenti]MCS7468619.1 exo-alpha-sialidase [Stieleria sedimenti]
MMQICFQIGLALVALITMVGFGDAVRADELVIQRSVIAEGDSDRDWTQARTAIVPLENRSFVFTTMSRTEKVGAHGYHDVFAVFGDRDADKWTQPIAIESLRRARQDDGYEVVAGDLCPIWHLPTEKVLITGKTFNFADGTKENILREQVAYCVFDPASRDFGPLHTMKLPQQDHAGHPIIAPNAGCHQQVILDDGIVLLPIRYQRSKTKRIYVSIVARCRFDGKTLEYLDHGTEHSIPFGRGLYEPSVSVHDGAYFLTLRANDGAWVARSSDGTNYSDHVAWKFDNGQPLGSYNTQQHWVTLGNRLYLVYTRRGANNDHIMRHRAPLFLAEVDPQRLVVLKHTEQVIVPEDNATLGNSGVCRISDRESWITVAEGRVTDGKRKGENNRVFLVKLRAVE